MALSLPPQYVGGFGSSGLGQLTKSHPPILRLQAAFRNSARKRGAYQRLWPGMSAMGHGRVKTHLSGCLVAVRPSEAAQAASAAIRGLMPTMFMTRVRL